MTGRLHCYVYVTDDNGDTHGFGPDDTVPDWAVERITNPDVWADKPAKDADDEAPAPSDVGTPGGGSNPEPPPRAGKGSGRAEWAAYAASLGFEVDDDHGRDDIIAAIEAEGLPA